MPQESWFFVAYGAGVFWLSLRSESVVNIYALRRAWLFYALSIFTIALFTPIQAAVSMTGDSVLASVWARGISWTFLGLGVMSLSGAMLSSLRGGKTEPRG